MSVKLVDNCDGIELYRLESGNSYVEIMTYGARIHKICVPDKNGVIQDVVLGFENPTEYRGPNPYFNACIGRVANRIGGSSFVIDGQRYILPANERKNHLHGGIEGFDRKTFTATIDGDILRLKYLSVDGEEGYPGNLQVTVEYSFADGNLKIAYFAYSDRPTHCNLTNHAYFNLNGDYKSIVNHRLFIKSHSITNIDNELIPNGEILDIKGTKYDFSCMRVIGEHLFDNDGLLHIAGGYDFNYILDNDGGAVAEVIGDKSGIVMRVYTDRPCVQFYSGNFLDGTVKGKAVFNRNCAIALETQGYPNACNIPSFPTTLIGKDGFKSETTYSFSVID